MKMAYPASKNVDHYLSVCQNVFLALSLMHGALWILSVGWVSKLQTTSHAGCHPKRLAQSHRENLISDMPRCHPVKSKLAMALLGSVFRCKMNPNISKFRNGRWQKEYMKPRETSSTKIQYFCCPNSVVCIKPQLLKFCDYFLRHHFTEIVSLVLLASE